MTTPTSIELSARSMNYVECDLAPELSLPQWRRTRMADRGRPLTLRDRLASIRRRSIVAD